MHHLIYHLSNISNKFGNWNWFLQIKWILQLHCNLRSGNLTDATLLNQTWTWAPDIYNNVILFGFLWFFFIKKTDYFLFEIVNKIILIWLWWTGWSFYWINAIGWWKNLCHLQNLFSFSLIICFKVENKCSIFTILSK